MGILAWIVFGLIVGFVARWVVPGEGPGGILGDIVVGIIGALARRMALRLFRTRRRYRFQHSEHGMRVDRCSRFVMDFTRHSGASSGLKVAAALAGEAETSWPTSSPNRASAPRTSRASTFVRSIAFTVRMTTRCCTSIRKSVSIAAHAFRLAPLKRFLPTPTYRRNGKTSRRINADYFKKS